MKLHEITNDIQALMDTLLEHEGEMNAEAEGLLGRLEEDLKGKTTGYCKAVRILESQAAVAQSEIDRLQKLAQARSKSAQRLKDWLKAQA